MRLNFIISWRKTIPLSFAATVLLLGLLWLLDFPKPCFDDLFFCGAALNLASGGDFSNPMLARQGFPGHLFFLQPPFHSYALAGWMKLFGINTPALLGFQLLTYMVAAGATIVLLRRHAAPRWLEFMAPLAVTAAFLPLGLRPDPLAIALTMLGYVFIHCGSKRWAPVASGFLLMFLGGSIAPRMTVFSAALVALSAWELWRESTGSGWRRWGWCVWALAGLALAGIIFLWQIDFRLGEFMKVFRYHAAGRVGGDKLHRFYLYFHGLGFMQAPFYLVPMALLFPVLRRPKDDLALAGILISCTLLLTVAMGVQGPGTNWWMLFTMLLLGGALLKSLAPSRAALLQVVIALVLLVGNRKYAINTFGVLTGKISSEPGEQFNAALGLRPTDQHPVLVDSSTARYVFDYHIPPGSLDWQFAAPFPGSTVIDTPLRPGDIYLVASSSVDLLNENTYLNVPTSKWVPLGLKKLACDAFPHRVFIIPAEECKTLREPPMVR